MTTCHGGRAHIERAYTIGQRLPGGARLLAIDADKVELQYGAMRTKLKIERHESNNGQVTINVSAASDASEMQNVPAPQPAVAQATYGDKPVLTRLLQLRRKVLADRP